MAQIMYTYPAMLALAGEMHGYGGAIRSVGSAVSSEQAALAGNWIGDTGMTYQAWQGQWNSGLEELVNAYQQLTSAHENNTMSMMGRDAAEAAKWGG